MFHLDFLFLLIYNRVERSYPSPLEKRHFLLLRIGFCRFSFFVALYHSLASFDIATAIPTIATRVVIFSSIPSAFHYLILSI